MMEDWERPETIARVRREIFQIYLRQGTVPEESSSLWQQRSPLHALDLTTAKQKMLALAEWIIQFAEEQLHSDTSDHETSAAFD